MFYSLGRLVESLRGDGRRVAYLSCYPGDDRFIMEIMRGSGTTDADYVAAYADHEAGIQLLARAGVVVAERLHAAVVAAAVGTPFVAIEYRPKIRDFTRSVGQEAATIRSDELSPGRLRSLVDSSSAGANAAALNAAVEALRWRQRRAATLLGATLND